MVAVALALTASLYVVPALAHPESEGVDPDREDEFTPPCLTDEEWECPYGNEHRPHGNEDCPHWRHWGQKPEGSEGYAPSGCGGMMRGGHGRGWSRGMMHGHRRGWSGTS